MTTTPTGLDQHAAVCAALARTTPLLCAVIEHAVADARPRGMRWTCAEIGAHLVASVTEATEAVHGRPSAYDAPPSAALDESMVAAVPERDPRVLARLLRERTASFLAVVSNLPGAQPVAAQLPPVGALTGLLVLDHHLHGGQVAETAGASGFSGSTWTADVAELHPALSAVVPAAFDAEAARGLRGAYALRLRGMAPVTYAVDDGALVMGVPGRIDCVITTDVPTFLRLGIGAVSQARAVLTGRLRVGGRRPWLAGRVQHLFPPVPHGGVAR